MNLRMEYLVVGTNTAMALAWERMMSRIYLGQYIVYMMSRGWY